ncbi:N-acetyl-gamma-glutamyl-phosphate reductase [Oecophyllibacter saccharovorans]|uniref:N-acetyl-gamma-glutamyl-phosphate reductase n=1 Tax=Oecophyllibacter saccharovorans TaxID=2558360 RepID=A0A506ULD3_9PROT|nr:N-acetyl-gamma-glutamyl-phosphate reductase [Oecophyllibacter saccharovorans]TPW34151.1 N-acetyl-gamma-glutamyl-phosphate reductase [Oecophyllibacter saccharovorans]
MVSRILPRKTRVFIDGEAGTTGLGIRQRLEALPDPCPIECLKIHPGLRKDPEARFAMMEQADITVLCLPDDAAREAVALGKGSGTRFLDASTAHRVSKGWVYGLPELESGQPERIRHARHVSNPGCYATGAIALLRPLVQAGVLPAEAAVSINAVSGYSGGGRKMIEAHARDDGPAFKLYGLDLQHKHLPEITQYSGLAHQPLFVPSVGHFPQGMIVSIPLHLVHLPGCPSVSDLRRILQEAYPDETPDGAESAVRVIQADETGTELLADSLAGDDRMELRVHGHGGQAVLTARLDNLGKGASGAAVRNLLLMSGQPLPPLAG